MDFKKKYKAEDLLADRIPEDEQHMLSSSERELANEVKTAFKKLRNERLTELEKEALWDEIRTNTNTATLNRKIHFNKVILKIAACLLIVGMIGYWQYTRYSASSKLLAFAEQNVSKKSISDLPTTSSGDENGDDALLEEDEKDNIITTNEFNTLVVANGLRSVIKLPDGTKVWLNSNSRLIYPISFSGKSREVFLEGEAYFDVSHDQKRPFFVHSKNMDIEVLGTEFFVSSANKSEKNYAVLIKGSISFSTGSWINKKHRKLIPGERINLNLSDQELDVSQVVTTEFQSWKEGYLNVESESLDIIINKIAKYYNIEINISGLDLSHDKFSGRLDFQRNADDVLNMLCIGTQYRYNGKERRLELKQN